MNSYRGEKKTVLLVDDEVDLTKMLSMILETRGYKVKVANTGAEAIEIASPEIDIIILDLILPDFHGFEVCRRLKQIEETRHIPIIMLSAEALNEDRIEGLYLGADDFIVKPCGNEELVARMEAVMRRGPNQVGDAVLYDHQEVVIRELHKIYEQGLIVPHFQPIYLFEPFGLYGLEMLTRPATDSILSNPEVFFKAAMQYGMYLDLEILSWSMALDILSEIQMKEKIFFNCNPYLIESSQSQRVKELLQKHQIPFDRIVMEITERSAISDYKLFYEHLHKYKESGFNFAVDDVGGGYASLETIVEIKPEVVKIDRHIIQSLQKDSFKRSIVKFIVGLCKENNIFSIAEGIENENELQIVRELGVDGGQGYYLYKPTSKIDLDDFRKTPH
ncbi:MAG: EAL domain-containing protein [Candidatus Omnitrophica bacterium]|nr:EAL domain-containing protein [Candidatus Omnitrophota bacterium]